jgi:hypothetical protein
MMSWMIALTQISTLTLSFRSSALLSILPIHPSSSIHPGPCMSDLTELNKPYDPFADIGDDDEVATPQNSIRK